MTDKLLREALTFYASYEGWDEYDPAGCDQTIILDGGDIARTALAAAPQPAPDREEMVRVIRRARHKWLADDAVGATVSTFDDAIADALLARGLRLPAPETMAWAVVEKDGTINPNKISEYRPDYVAKVMGDHRVQRVAIRVAEGGDDASLDRIRALVKEADEKGLWRTETIKMPKRVVEGGDDAA